MTPTTNAQHGLPTEDYGLDIVARHNAATLMEQFPPYQEDPQGLGIYDEYSPLHQDEKSYIQDPPTPRSTLASEGIRTRSGRSTRQTDSPFSTTKSRVSKSPVRRKKEKKSKVDMSKMPTLPAPISVLTRHYEIPVKDTEAYVNRSIEERQKEMDEKGYTTRPMNSFMLYRAAFAERTKAWCAQNNHQVVSSISGMSWPMEPDEVRSQFDEWAKMERQHHQEAHPDYKFSPSKPATKRRKGGLSDDEYELSDLERNPDGEYRGARNVRHRRQNRDEPIHLPSTVSFSSYPYYGQQVSGYEQSQYQYPNPGHPMPSNITYDRNSIPYNLLANMHLASSMHNQQSQYQPFMQEMHAVRVPTPSSLSRQQSLGGYGLPGGQMQQDEVYYNSRTGTPMQHYQLYGQPVYLRYEPQYEQGYQPVTTTSAPQLGPQLYEHQQYLQQASQPEAAIEPSLEAAIEGMVASGGQGMPLANSHFDDAVAAGIDHYFERSSSPTDVNATLAPTWSPKDLKG